VELAFDCIAEGRGLVRWKRGVGVVKRRMLYQSVSVLC
jgi:hypothetical protein